MKKKTRLNGTRLAKLPKQAITARSAKTPQKHRKRARSASAEPGVMSIAAAPPADKAPGAPLTPFSFWARAPLAMMELWLAPFARAKTVSSESKRS